MHEDLTQRVPITQEEFDRFVIAALECYHDEWYVNDVLRSVADKYGFEYEDIYYA
jgi:hypothetical protein